MLYSAWAGIENLLPWNWRNAPNIAGRGVANPISAILSVAMLLEYSAGEAAARRIEAAVAQALA